MPAKDLPKTPDELRGLSATFFERIKGESDRECVLVAAAFLDEALELLLRSRMLRDPGVVKQSIDPLFTGTGPLRSFWAKTELCQALDLLYREEHADLVRVRNLRNYFAHSYVDASFGSQKANDLVSELHHLGMKQFPLIASEQQRASAVRQRFSLSASWLAGGIHKRAGMAGASEPADTAEAATELNEQG